jgi:hypothetical protein
MTNWTVLKAAHPESANLTLTADIQRLLGLEGGDAATRTQLERNLVFLARPKGWLRVLPAFHFQELVTKETRMDRFVAMAPYTATSPGSLLLNLPRPAAVFLRLKEFEGADTSSRAPMDSIAWIAPKEEWDAIRWKEGGGTKRKTEPHVYLARDSFDGAFPTLHELEGHIAPPKLVKPIVKERTERFSFPPGEVAAQMFRRPAIVRSIFENVNRYWAYEWSPDGGEDLERRWKGKLMWKGNVRFHLALTETVREAQGGSIFVSRLETRSSLGRVHSFMSGDIYRGLIDWEKELDIRTAYARESLEGLSRQPSH